MQGTIHAVVKFAAHQLAETVRRPSRLIWGFPFVRRAQTVIAAGKVQVSKQVDSDVQRIFALVTSRLVHEAYPSGYRISKVWRGHLRHALAKAGRHPSAGLLACLSLSIFDLELKRLSASDREIISRRRRDFNRRHNELSSLRESQICPENTVVAVDGGTHSTRMD